MIKILAINPGSTSTKIAVFHNSRPIFLKNIVHHCKDIEQFQHITEQYEFRKNTILKELNDSHIDISKIQAIVGRGGLLKPIKSGIYRINDRMKSDLHKNIFGEHASNLGALIADDLAKQIPGCQAFIADPVVVDELEDVARYSGHPQFKRYSIFHALNQKAIGRAYARLINKKYDELNLIIAHMGGGVSVGAHHLGRVIDVNQALDGEGPFSSERSGTLPAGALARACFENGMTLDKMQKMITGHGGLMAYLGTNSAYEVELMVEDGNDEARKIQDAMSYQIAKEIGAMAAVLKGQVDAVILTGGISHNTMIIEYIKSMVSFIAPVIIYPGEDEMHALAWNGLLALNGNIVIKDYDETNMVEA